MSDATNNQTTESKLPSHTVYHIRDRENGKGFWTRIGSAWAHKDGNGFNIQIEIVPLDGRITLRVATEKKD
jgi:hypothetical protein